MTAPLSPQPRFSNDEEFERLFRAHPWEKTRLGQMESWPLSLRGYVSMMLKLPTPAIIFWGPDHLQLYNAGYAVIMGPRHPKYLGATYAESWPDTHPTIHPWMKRVLGGEVLEVVNAPFTLTRHGFNEETYFTFSFSPLRDDSGAIAGFFQPVFEKTPEVLAERRVATLRGFAPETASSNVSEALQANLRDIPFSLVSVWSEAEQALVLEACSGLAAKPAGVPEAVQRAFEVSAPQLIERVEDVLGMPHVGIWGDPTRTALALPVRRSDADPARGVVVLGISPRLPFDDAYRGFFEAVARELAANLAAGQERTARQEAERERQNLHDFFMQTPAPLCILMGPEHRFVLANTSYIGLVGREVVGKTVAELFGPETLSGYLAILDAVYRTGEPFVGKELPLRLRADEEILINMSYTALRSGDGAVKGILVFAYDITAEVKARRRSESLAAELQSAMRARDDFLSIASHELRTPLTSLRLQIQMAQRGLSLPDPGKLLKQANRLTRLMDDMLDISRINAGKLALEPAAADLAEIVNDVLDRFEPQLAAVGSQVRRQTAPGLVGTWDAHRIEQVLTNLITNAMKYAPGKPVEVTTARQGDAAVITVRDHGPGVAPQDRERIFGRFERATRANDVSGLGLGLYISRQIVEAHGGRIRVDSGPGGGAAFVVELPIS